MSEAITIRNAAGKPIWYATFDEDSINLEFESYGRGPGDPDIESHESIYDSEFPKIRGQYGYQSNYPIAKILQELSNSGRGEEFKEWAESNIEIKADFVWWSFDD